MDITKQNYAGLNCVYVQGIQFKRK